MVASAEVEVGISNAMEVHDGFTRGLKDLAHHRGGARAARRLLGAQGLAT